MAAGGTSNALTGGNFWNGALSAGFAEGTNPYLKDIPGGSLGQAAGAAASGAAASWLGGGDAGQGAITGLAGYLFNEKGHYSKNADGTSSYKSPLDDPQQTQSLNAYFADAIPTLYAGVIGLIDQSPLPGDATGENLNNPFYPKGSQSPQPTYWQTLDTGGQTLYTIGAAVGGAAIFAITDKLPEANSPALGAIGDSKPAYDLRGPRRMPVAIWMRRRMRREISPTITKPHQGR